MRYFLLTTRIGGGRTRITIGRTVGRDAPKRFTSNPPGVEWILTLTKRSLTDEELSGFQRAVDIMNKEQQ